MDYKQLTHFFIGSKTRTSILVLYIIGVKDEFYLREISRLVKISAGNVRRELMMLEKAGIMKSRKEANLKYYSLDTDSPYYRPFCEIVAKSAGIIDLFKIPLQRNNNIIVSFIYGSYAKGNFDNKSDIDLFILTDKNSTVFQQVNLLIDELEQKFGREINPTIIQHEEFNKKMKQKDSFLFDILAGEKMFLKGGEIDIRSKIGGSAKS